MDECRPVARLPVRFAVAWAMFLVASPEPAYPQPPPASPMDTERFAEPQAAFERGDRQLAVISLDEISPPRRAGLAWRGAAPRANECADDLEAALGHYRASAALLPGNAEILEVPGDVRYRLSKRQEDEAKAAARADCHRNCRKSGLRETCEKQTYQAEPSLRGSFGDWQNRSRHEWCRQNWKRVVREDYFESWPGATSDAKRKKYDRNGRTECSRIVKNAIDHCWGLVRRCTMKC